MPNSNTHAHTHTTEVLVAYLTELLKKNCFKWIGKMGSHLKFQRIQLCLQVVNHLLALEVYVCVCRKVCVDVWM